MKISIEFEYMVVRGSGTLFDGQWFRTPDSDTQLQLFGVPLEPIDVERREGGEIAAVLTPTGSLPDWVKGLKPDVPDLFQPMP